MSRSRSRCWADGPAPPAFAAPVLPSSPGGCWTPATCSFGGAEDPRERYAAPPPRARPWRGQPRAGHGRARIRVVCAGSDPGASARSRPPGRRSRPRPRPTPGAASPTPAPTAPAVNPTPAGPRQSGNPGEEQTPGPSVAPSPVPSAQPSPVPSVPVVTQPTASATPGPIAVVHNPARPTAPQATPAPPQATPTPTRVPVSDGPGTPPACHASERGQAASDGKACQHRAHKPAKDHHDNGRHRGAAARRPDGQADRQPAIAESRAASKTRHRLRVGRRAR